MLDLHDNKQNRYLITQTHKFLGEIGEKKQGSVNLFRTISDCDVTTATVKNYFENLNFPLKINITSFD